MASPTIPGMGQPQPAAAPANPQSLGFQLPWQALAAGGNAFAGFGGDPGQAAANLGTAYNQNYQAALNLNAGIYSGVSTSYDKLRSQMDSQYQDIFKGYQGLYGDVLGRIAGTNESNLTDINSQYAALSGQAAQNAVSRGLGNSTVQGNMQRGIALDQARARTASQNQFAQLQAGYASQLGQAGLQSQQQGAQTGASLGVDQLRFLGSTTAPYPNAGLYSQMAQMYGAQQQADQTRGQVNQLTGGGRTFNGAMGAPVGGGSSGLGPMPGPSMRDPGYGTSAIQSSLFGGGVYGGFASTPAYQRPEGFMSGDYQNPDYYDQGPGAGGEGGQDVGGWSGEGLSYF